VLYFIIFASISRPHLAYLRVFVPYMSVEIIQSRHALSLRLRMLTDFDWAVKPFCVRDFFAVHGVDVACKVFFVLEARAGTCWDGAFVR